MLVIRNIRSRKEILFALFPMLFAAQQLIEGTLWLVVRNSDVSPRIVTGLAFAFLVFAYGLWPVLCPLSVYAIEYDPRRRRLLCVLTGLGALISLYLMLSIVLTPPDVEVWNSSLRYLTEIKAITLLKLAYITTTILPYFISSQRPILIFALPNMVFCFISYFFYRSVGISVWCFFAAILSLTLYVFLKKLHHEPILPDLNQVFSKKKLSKGKHAVPVR